MIHTFEKHGQTVARAIHSWYLVRECVMYVSHVGVGLMMILIRLLWIALDESNYSLDILTRFPEILNNLAFFLFRFPKKPVHVWAVYKGKY